MNLQQTLASLTRWGARNLAYNLDFIPEDKLDWKPAAEALSALEIVNHILTALQRAQTILDGGGWDDWKEADFVPTTTLEEAKAALVATADKYATTLEALQPPDLERLVQTPYGTFPLTFIMRNQPVDIIHHHGQVAYIQRMLGDTENHFDPIAFS